MTHSDLDVKQFKEIELQGIKTRSLNIIEQDIGQAEYDMITAWEVIEHMPIEVFDKVMDRIKDALKPEGLFVFSTPDMDSPRCQMNDFFAACPPFHYTVFGKKWLKEYFVSHGWNVIETVSCSDFLDDYSMWRDYAKRTSPSFQLRVTASVLEVLFREKIIGIFYWMRVLELRL